MHRASVSRSALPLLVISLLGLVATPPPSVLASGADGAWFPVPMGPSPDGDVGFRSEHSMIFDPVRQRFLLFGGQARGVGAANDVWQRSVGSAGFWTKVTTSSTAPAGRSSHTAVYDPVADRMIVYGGRTDAGAFLNDVWELKLSETPPRWNPLAPVAPGPRRYGHTAVFDPARRRMLVFAGLDSLYRNDVWSLDVSTSTPVWQALTVSLDKPRVRAYPTAVFDAAHDQMVVFGGQDAFGNYPDLWTLSSFSSTPTWVRRVFSSPPGERARCSSGIDPSGNRMVVFGGELDAIWGVDLTTYAWSSLAPAAPPQPRSYAGFAIDPASRTAILQGGSSLSTGVLLNDTWSFDLGSLAWTNLVPATPPPPLPPPNLPLRYGSAGVFDPLRDRFLMVGGGSDGGLLLGDLAELKIGRDSSWVPVTIPSLKPRKGHSAVYDPIRDRMLVFGGFDGVNTRSDLWEIRLAPLALNELHPTGSIGTRDYATMVYDPVRDRVVLYGGEVFGTQLGDVMALNLSPTPAPIWEALTTQGTPPLARSFAASIYDPYADRMLIYGGWDGTSASRELWALSFTTTPPTWTRLTPSGFTPGQRYGASLVLDPNRRRAVLFGGHDFAFSTNYGDLWQLTLDGPLAWQRLLPALSPTGGAPPARYLHLGIFDPIQDRMLVSGGTTNGTTSFGDVWQLQFSSEQPTATALALVASDVQSDRVTLEWTVPGEAANAVRLERREVSHDWRMIGSVGGSSSGTFVDRDVVAGGRYGYRLTAFAGSGASISPEVWIDVPASTSFGLTGFSPNPAMRELRVSFSLAERTPATIEVIDLGGRRVASRRIESPATGAQSIAMAPEGGLSPGLYFVRLTQGSRTLVARGSVMR